MNACQRKIMGWMKVCNIGEYNWWYKIDVGVTLKI